MTVISHFFIDHSTYKEEPMKKFSLLQLHSLLEFQVFFLLILIFLIFSFQFDNFSVILELIVFLIDTKSYICSRSTNKERTNNFHFHSQF
ncbi:hypothetical protein CISIN_1g035943mg [Citrus sinensis]|uniref:Uncharacterized protein n=1 Tax=Citrus sinensis TaxID=2711 RepID=A0A067D811_CITSI|nr:hypothetical protein CISIN_1g035943mg [Citrus sinensis]